MIQKTVLACCAFAVLTIGACTGIQTRAQKIDAACASATAALRVIAVGVERGQVSAAQQRAAVEAGEAIAPICAAPERPSLEQAKQAAFNAAIARIVAIAQGAQ